MQRGFGEKMPKKLKVKKCPLGKTKKLKGWKCRRCKHYNPRKWYSIKGEVDVFCDAEYNPHEKKYLKK